MPNTTFALDALPCGSVLGQALVDERGHVLLAAGTELTDRLVDMLRRRDVTSVVVATPESLPAADAAILQSEAAALAERHEARLLHLFRHTLRSGRINPLLHLVRLQNRVEIE